ncbi:hypothetical protein WICMUC_001086 [Wickerhamomyces mucosus]|uniref:Uncharacterized protein n=1 Tax=Wickerhamomyces mucosus TaxID=1378264 RepID=A0A9P8PW02_9ASCO|nr:hypothetical protein WICMUC_001086 [Wickerhamomyces mucosus]
MRYSLQLLNEIPSSLRALKLATSLDLKTYQEISPIAGHFKASTASSNNSPLQVLMCNKSVKDFNMAEVQKLIEIDLKYSDVKFALLTDDFQMSKISINPLIRNLLNNGINYGIYLNNKNQVYNILQKIPDVQESVEQVWLIVNKTKNHSDGNEYLVYKEITEKIDPSFTYKSIPIKIEEEEFNLTIPSLAILPRIMGIGIPKSHPRYKELLHKEVELPGIKTFKFKIITIREADAVNGDIFGLFPKHILSHQDYFDQNIPVTEPTKKVKYNNEFYNDLQISELMSTKYNVSAPFFEIIPYIMRVYKLKGQRITKIINNFHVFDETKNESLNLDPTTRKSVVSSSLLSSSYDKSFGHRTPLNRISFREVLNFINFKNSFKFKDTLGFEMNSDILRSYLIKYKNEEFLDQSKFKSSYDNLQILTFFYEYYLNENNIEKGFDYDFNKLDRFDRYLLHGFTKLNKGQIDLNYFTNYYLTNFFIYYQTSSDIFDSKTRGKLFNLILFKLLNSEVRTLYPMFFNYYQNELIHIGEEQKIIPEIPANLETKDNERSLFQLIFKIYSEMNLLPSLYQYKISLESWHQDDHVNSIAAQLVKKFNNSDQDNAAKLIKDVKYKGFLFHTNLPSNNIEIRRFRTFDIDDLISRLKFINFSIPDANEPIESIKLRIRFELINDLEKLKAKSQELIQFIDKLLDQLPPDFVTKFTEFNENEILETLNSSIHDYESKINPFVMKSN